MATKTKTCSCRGCGGTHNGKPCAGCATNLLDKPVKGCDTMYHSIVSTLETEGTTCGQCGKKVPADKMAKHPCFQKRGDIRRN